MFELKELKQLRMKLGLTQTQLAHKANVSQSLIAKIETDRIDPSYTNAKKLFETLSMLDTKSEKTAADIMHKRIISISSTTTLKNAIKLMRQKSISQVPVVERNKVIGYISESAVLEKILEGATKSPIKEIMKDAPPIMPPDTSQGVVAHLLNHFPFILVEDKGVLGGIITKADLLKSVYK
ncbi:MAG: CBS domain-containing protein [archaeon]